MEIRALAYQENSAPFQELFNAAGKTNYRITIIPGLAMAWSMGMSYATWGTKNASGSGTLISSMTG